MRILIGVLVAFFSLTAWSTDRGHLTIEGVKPARVAEGGEAEAVVEIRVRDGFHVQANPASMPQLIATKLDVSAKGGMEPQRPVYPKGKMYKIEGLKTSVATYDGRFEIKVPIRAASNTSAKKLELEAKLRYQACDDKVCFPPTVSRFAIPVEVGPRS